MGCSLIVNEILKDMKLDVMGAEYDFTHQIPPLQKRPIQEQAGKKLTGKSPETGWCGTLTVPGLDPGRISGFSISPKACI